MDIVRFVAEHIEIQETVSVKIHQLFRNTVVFRSAVPFSCMGSGPAVGSPLPSGTSSFASAAGTSAFSSGIGTAFSVAAVFIQELSVRDCHDNGNRGGSQETDNEQEADDIDIQSSVIADVDDLPEERRRSRAAPGSREGLACARSCGVFGRACRRKICRFRPQGSIINFYKGRKTG